MAMHQPSPIGGYEWRVEAIDYHDIAGQLAAAERAADRDQPLILALGQSAICWLVEANGQHACIRCFQLWRFDSVSLKATTDAAMRIRTDPQSAQALPLMDAMIHSYRQTLRASQQASQQAWGHVRRIDMRNGEISDHRLLRHLECDRCGRQGETYEAPEADNPCNVSPISPDLRGASLADISAHAVPVLVDERLGPIRSVEHGLSPAIISVAEAATCPEDAPDRFDNGYGRTGNLLDDPTIAVIEAAERYAGMRPRARRNKVRARFGDVADYAIDPELFILHDEAQGQQPDFRLARFHCDREIDWVWAYSFRSEQPRLIPAQLAYFALPAEPAGGRFVLEVSNGCAAGSTPLEAAVFGLLEVIERDAFLASWYSNRAIARVDVAGCNNPRARALMARLKAEGLEVEVFDIGVGLPAATLAVKVVDPDRRFGPSMAYAAAAHLTADGALVGALQEVATILEPVSAQQRLKNDDRGRELLANPSLVKSMPDHTLQCWPQEAIALRSFNESQTASLTWHDYARSAVEEVPDIHSDFSGLLKGTLAHCHDVLFVDQSFEPVRFNGLRFGKILAPGLLPMTFGHAYRRISHDRLARIAGGPGPGACRQDPHVFP